MLTQGDGVAGKRLDGQALTALAEALKINNSLTKLNLSREHGACGGEDAGGVL